jgi:L-histidine Nalpha-methyltransferase / hercynylcysteine S-oxide synthase
MVVKPKVSFALKAESYARNPVASLDDWNRLWAAWDAVTLSMIPKDELLSKPIKLRNACIFYLGHIPTFLDIHLTRATGSPPTEPASYQQIFERGIDPDVENPELCHDHSEIPDTWPPLEEILAFQHNVRERVKKICANGVPSVRDPVGRALWIGYEHEMMHLETLLYMLVQSEKTLPPPAMPMPDFQAMAVSAGAVRPENKWFKIPEAEIQLGMDDARFTDTSYGYFGWDNEIPRRAVHVKPFEAQARPITNGEYAEYLKATGNGAVPASWCDSGPNGSEQMTNGSVSIIDGDVDILGDKFVRTVFGAVPLKYVLDWPVVASFDELKGYANWFGGRIPTMEEVRSIYSYVDKLSTKEAGKTLANTIPAVNG